MLANGMDATTPLHCHVEIPKGSRNKYEWDEGLHAIKLNRFLFASVVYPTDYGFIPETIGPKDQALDAMVCVSAPTFPGCLIPVRVVAIMRSRDEKGQNDKLLCVPEGDPGWSFMERLDDLPAQLRSEIEHFFTIYKTPEGKQVEIQGWEDSDVALEVIAEGRRRYAQERT
jgi:inorganic pyrophosphatase